MFMGASSLKTLDLSGFDTKKVSVMPKISERVNLVSGDEPKMAENKLSSSNRDWMRIDRPGTPGCLTLLK